MLFISILLSVWFMVWLVYAVFVKDVGKIIVSYIEYMTADEEEDEDVDQLMQKSDEGCVYHLNCDECNYDWWSIEPNVNYCPNCGEKILLREVKFK